jgi:peptide/nickel transport system ATP-binding protein
MHTENENRLPILEINHLQASFSNKSGVVKAVDDISFQVYKGETVGIVGESGSGKSVTALSIMGLLSKFTRHSIDGEILFDSPTLGRINLKDAPKSTMRKVRGNEISMIFQEPMSSLNPVFTCGDQVMEAILLHQNISKKEAREKTLELFAKVQLPSPAHIFKSYPHEISGGQKQRVMIAMAMSCSPAILIADEPTTALDVTVQANILKLMKQLRDNEDTSIVFISHDLGVIAEIADRVIVMYQGKIVEQGTLWEIFSNPKHPYTKGLLACRPRVDIKLKVLPTISDFMDRSPEGELTEVVQKYSSVGEALLLNAQSQDEIRQRREKLYSTDPILKVENLKTYFPLGNRFWGKPTGLVKAVDDVSFEVYPGETLGLVGESGCGKTTLGRSILRLIEPTAGKIYFEDEELGSFSNARMRMLRKEMQIIFQDPYASLNPRMTVGEAIMEPMQVHRVLSNNKERKERVVELLETVNLKGEYFYRYPHEFSGGQRQRICIARTLALNPRFIICDESVSALDVSVQAQVLNLLNDLKAKYNFTYIFISHDLGVVKFISDRILVMNKGKIEEKGYPEALFENPQNDYTRKLIEAIPRGDLQEIRRTQMLRKITQ